MVYFIRSFGIGLLCLSLFWGNVIGTSLGNAGAPYHPVRKCIQVVSSGYFYSDLEKKSPLAPKPLPIRLYTNLKRWYFAKDTRDLTEKPFHYLNDYDYLTKKRSLDKLGVVRSEFLPNYDTRLYYTATAVPALDGKIPLVDPKSRALYFYFHGSGTMKASGVNFSYKMNKMAAMGYSVIAMDLPWHSDGSQSSSMTIADKFYSSLREMIHEFKRPGMPVYLAGHSFGPDIVAEYVKRYPKDLVDGVVMISPGGFTPELEHWYMNHTAEMSALWGDLISNDDGAAWAGLISSQHKWRKAPTEKDPDPTLVNPKLRVHILSGEYEEYVPGPLDNRGLPTKEPRTYDIVAPLKNLMANADIIIEPGVGHYIFEHKDKNGHDVILRELLRINNQSIENEKELKATANFNRLSDDQEIGRKFVRDPFFKMWMEESQGGWPIISKILKESDVVTARRLLNNFSRYVEAQREKAVVANLMKTQEWNPEFYNLHREEIESLHPQRPRPSDALINKYILLLESLSPHERDRLARAKAEDVYTIPERPAPPQGHEQNKTRGSKDGKKQEAS